MRCLLTSLQGFQLSVRNIEEGEEMSLMFTFEEGGWSGNFRFAWNEDVQSFEVRFRIPGADPADSETIDEETGLRNNQTCSVRLRTTRGQPGKIQLFCEVEDLGEAEPIYVTAVKQTKRSGERCTCFGDEEPVEEGAGEEEEGG